MELNILDLLVADPNDQPLPEPVDEAYYANYSGSDDVGSSRLSRLRNVLVKPAFIAPAWRAVWVDKGKKAIAHLDPVGRHAMTEYGTRLIPTDEFLARDADVLLRVAANKWPGHELRLGGSPEFKRVMALVSVQLNLDHLLEDFQLAQRVRNAWQFWPERHSGLVRSAAADLDGLRYEAQATSHDGLSLSHLAFERPRITAH